MYFVFFVNVFVGLKESFFIVIDFFMILSLNVIFLVLFMLEYINIELNTNFIAVFRFFSYLIRERVVLIFFLSICL